MVEPSVQSDPPNELANMQIAFAAVLAARKETFLARYPRKLKLAATAAVLLLLFVPVMSKCSRTTSIQQAVVEEKVEKEVKSEPVIPSGDKKVVRPVSVLEFKSDAERTAATQNDAKEGIPPLSVAPDPELAEETPYGVLPRISADGRKPWQVYAKVFDYKDPRPRVAIVVGELGFSRVATDAALRRLPPSVTLAFDVQADSIKEWLDRARQDGHETLLSVPMEPFDFPRSDPGPNALLTSLPNSDNVQRFMKALAKGVGYVGVTTFSGSRFSSDPAKVAPIVDILRNRGLLVLDPRVASHSTLDAISKEMSVPAAVNSRVIDSTPTPTAIDQALLELENTARVEGRAVGMATPLPVTLERIEFWSKAMHERGVVLAPISAVAK